MSLARLGPAAERAGIIDFAHALDKLVFSDTGFDLGVDDGAGTASPHAAALFSPNADGTFATTDNRFAYNQTNGRLFYDADGSGAGHARQVIATLAHPTLSASNLFFVG